MVIRILSSSLWFIAAGWGFNLLSQVTGAPPVAGIAFAAAVATFVGVDPLHLFWPVKAQAPVGLERDTTSVAGALPTQV